MAEYWVMDEKGLVLGPVGLQVLRDIAAGSKMGHLTRASDDGKTWVPLMQLPEVAQAVLPPAMVERQQQEQREAARVTRELERIRAMPAHALFGVPAGSSARTHREGFITLAKPYHPGRLPRDVHPDLLRACMSMFQFLSTRMAEVDQQEHRAGASASVTPSRGTPISPASGTPPSGTPRAQSGYADEAFVGFARTAGDRLEARVQVTPARIGIFNGHRLMNLATGGAFIPCPTPPPMGSVLEMVFHFGNPQRDVRTRAKVVCEDAGEGRGVRGFGVRFDNLSKDDQAFLQQFVRDASRRTA